MVRSTPAPFTLHPNSQGRYPGSPLSETEDSDDGVCPIPIAVPKAAFVAKTDRSGGRAPKQNAAGSSARVLGMSFDSQHQWVSVSTIHGNLIRVLVHPGMQILDFKDKCFENDLWSGTPISLLTPLAINVDLAAMMSEGKQVTDPRPWQMKGRYNRFRLCTKDGALLDDEEVLQEDMLTDCKLFKVQWMKQFNLRVEEEASLVQCMTSEQHVVSFDMTFNHNTSFRAFPFYGNEGQLHGLVYQHNESQGHCE